MNIFEVLMLSSAYNSLPDDTMSEIMARFTSTERNKLALVLMTAMLDNLNKPLADEDYVNFIEAKFRKLISEQV